MLDRVLITHTHFDHIGGAAELVRSFSPHPLISIHPDDLALWQAGGGASNFGFHVDLDVEFKTDLADKQVIKLGSEEILVRHTPGHSRGHVIFIIPSLKCALVGDLIFYLGVGRTDLPGGDGSTLIKSIRESILTLDNETKLFPGHGPFTTVGYERENNPFL
jgi:glyoxylase-like metal-dependent hydrolase (beta-lactamase superfamily II)